jgi:hypothetical protein
MRKYAIAICLTLILSFFAAYATAAEKAITAKADQVTVAKDKNGHEYVRVTITEQRELSGMKYTTGVPVMFFGALVEKAKTLKAGNSFTAIVQPKDYQGRTSYTGIALK